MTDQVRRERPHFAMVPEPLLFSGLSDRAVRLYGVLDRFAGQRVKAWPSRSTLAALMAGCSQRSVDRAVEELEESGYLKVERRRGAKAVNRYTLLQRVRKASTSSAKGARNGADSVNSGSAKNSTRTIGSEPESTSNDCSLCEGQRWTLGDGNVARLCECQQESA